MSMIILTVTLAAAIEATRVFPILILGSISWVNHEDYIDLTMHIQGDFCVSWAPSVHGMSGTGVTGYVPPSGPGFCVDFDSYDTDIRPTAPRAILVSYERGTTSNVTCRLMKRLYAIRDGPQRVITSMSGFNMAQNRSMPHVEKDHEWREVFTMDVVAGTLTSYTYRNVFIVPIAVYAGVVVVIGIVVLVCKVVLTPRGLTVAKVLLTVFLLIAVALYMVLAGLPHPTLTSVMYAMGEGTMLLTGLVMFPVTKFVSIALWTYGTSYERMVPWHVLLGVLLVVVGLAHGVLALVTIGIQEPEGLGYLRRGWLSRGNVAPIPGIVALALLLALAIPAFLRQFAYTFFRVSHMLIVPYVVFAILHYRLVGVAIAPALALYALDVVWRVVPTLRHGTAAVVSSAVRGDVAEVRLAAPWTGVEAGQYALLARIDKCANPIPHPFTIAHFNADTKEATFYIKRGGAWTSALVEGLQEGKVERMMVQGPYGSLMVPVERCGRVLIVTGGIGVTPMLSIAEAALRAGKPVRFVWTVRDGNAVTQIANHLRHLSSVSAEVALDIYVTSREPIETPNLPGANMLKGRPEIAAITAKEAEQCGEEPLGVYACGPAQMMSAAEAAASATPKCLFHAETFEF